jgi:hypothetical protein
VPNGCNANRLSAVSQLVENPIGPDSQRVEAPEFPSKCITGEGVTLKQRKGILDRINQRPVECKQVSARSPGKDEPGHRLASARPTFCEFGSKLGEGYRLVQLDLGETLLQGRKSIRIGKDLSRLLQRLVLVYRNQSRCGSPVASDQDVIPSITDVV